MSTGEPTAPATRWRVLTASERGAAHDALGLPDQDAVETRDLNDHGVVVAVADGHGHRRHFRSERGARIAVAVACDVAGQQTAWLAGITGTAGAEQQASQVLVPALTSEWRARVRADAQATPLSIEEQVTQVPGDDILIGYGTTLLVAVVWDHWLVLAQIGDGDIVGIQPAGGALLAVPSDPLLDGRYTTSMCGPDAEGDFRVAAVDLSGTPLLGVMLTTDGYGNAQAAEAWEDMVSTDLAKLITGRSQEWLAEQVPLWARRCASPEGSADDTTIALMLAPR